MSQSVGDFGPDLRRRRMAAGMSQAELAKLISYSESQLSKVENGRARPTPDFVRSCQRTLGGPDPVSEPVVAAEPRPARVGLCGLPGATHRFTGRLQERATIRGFLTDERDASVCVLAGMAGVGKTALAIRSAWDVVDAFPDGCLFFDLHGFGSGPPLARHHVLDHLLRLLGVPAAELPGDTDGRANLYRDRLSGRRMLLIFDNVRDTGQVSGLIPAEPRCRVLITSRNRLNALDDAEHVAVGVLSRAEAADLFRSVAGERVAFEDDMVVRIVEQCGRLPLAIRIAAARFLGSPQWTIGEFAARLADEAARLGELDDGERSVAAAFHLSYQALPADQRRLFGLLTLHPGRDIATRSAAALAGLGLAGTERLLDRLDQAHLIIRLPGGYVRFHDLVRAYAIEHALPAVATDDQEAAVSRLFDFALRQASAGDRLLSPQRYRPELALTDVSPIEPGFADREAALAWWDREWPNLVALCRLASAQSWHVRCWQLAVLLRDFFFRGKLWEPWIDTQSLAARSARATGDDRALAMTLNNLGMAHADRGDLAPARRYYAEALGLFDAIGDGHGVTARSNLAWVDLYLGDHESALRHLTLTLYSYRSARSARNAAITLRGIALAETALGRFDAALVHAERAYAEASELGLDLDMVMGRNCIAWIHFRAGHFQVAEESYARAAELATRSGSRHELTRAWTGLGNVAACTGDGVTAQRWWTRAITLHPALHPVMVGEAGVRLALDVGQASDDVSNTME